MSEYEETLAKLKELISRRQNSVSGFSYSEKLWIREQYMRVCFKEIRICKCNDTYKDACLEIYHRLKRQGGFMSQSKYKLKNGIVLHWSNEVYTNANLTDEVAAAYIQKYGTKFFEVVPDADGEEQPVSGNEETIQEVLVGKIRSDIEAGEKLTDIRKKYNGSTLNGVYVSQAAVSIALRKVKEGMA